MIAALPAASVGSALTDIIAAVAEALRYPVLLLALLALAAVAVETGRFIVELLRRREAIQDGGWRDAASQTTISRLARSVGRVGRRRSRRGRSSGDDAAAGQSSPPAAAAPQAAPAQGSAGPQGQTAPGAGPGPGTGAPGTAGAQGQSGPQSPAGGVPTTAQPAAASQPAARTRRGGSDGWVTTGRGYPSNAVAASARAIIAAGGEQEATEDALTDFDMKALRRLERTKILTRLGPALGLMGTLIPLAPALSALGRGDVGVLADELRTAFAITVLGLAVGVVAFCITIVRDRLYAEDLSRLERLGRSLRTGTATSDGDASATAHHSRVGGEPGGGVPGPSPTGAQ